MGMNATNSTEAIVIDGGLAVAFEVIAAGRVVKSLTKATGTMMATKRQPRRRNRRTRNHVMS
jgi:hypothetical protein